MKTETIHLIQTTKQYITSQLDNVIRPEFFIVLQWTPFALDYQTAETDSKHFKNVLLSSIYNCRLKELPEDKCRMAWFHEKAEVNTSTDERNPKYRMVYHSNLLIGCLPFELGDASLLEKHIKMKVRPRVKKLSRAESKTNKGFVIRKWEPEHHQFYNYKDLYKYHYGQDNDLVVDYKNSDFRRLSECGHQKYSRRGGGTSVFSSVPTVLGCCTSWISGEST